MTEYHTPPNEERVGRLYAFLSIDERGFNGIVAGVVPGIGSTPLVTSKRRIAHKLMPIAQEVADRTGLKVGLFAFARVEGEELWQSE
jgi:hypothetical protein